MGEMRRLVGRGGGTHRHLETLSPVATVKLTGAGDGHISGQ